MTAQSFRTTILAGKEKNVTGIELPADILAALGGGKRPRLKITLGDYSFVSSVGGMGGKAMISLSAAHRTAAGLTGGDRVEVRVELAPDPPAIDVPDDRAAARRAAGVTDAFDRAAPSRRKEWVRAIEEAKAAETRAKRIQKVIDTLSGA
jgi:hypothetical protein